jgi:hypothetical protein
MEKMESLGGGTCQLQGNDSEWDILVRGAYGDGEDKLHRLFVQLGMPKVIA